MTDQGWKIYCLTRERDGKWHIAAAYYKEIEGRQVPEDKIPDFIVNLTELELLEKLGLKREVS